MNVLVNFSEVLQRFSSNIDWNC